MVKLGMYQLRFLSNWQGLLGKEVFWKVTMKIKPDKLVREHIQNDNIKYSGEKTQPRVAAFKEIFDNKGDEPVILNMIVRWSGENDTGIVDRVLGEMKRDFTEGDCYRRWHPEAKRTLPYNPKFQKGQFSTIEERPSGDKVSMPITYPDFFSMATHFGYGIVQAHELEVDEVKQFKKSTGHSVKIIALEPIKSEDGISDLSNV